VRDDNALFVTPFTQVTAASSVTTMERVADESRCALYGITVLMDIASQPRAQSASVEGCRCDHSLRSRSS
jgi:hypothetical protein